MKHSAFVLFVMVGSLFFVSCQEKIEWDIDFDIATGNTESTKYDDCIDYEEIMTLGERYSQGGDCWGDYFFQFVKNNFQVRIYDLSSKTLIQKVNLAESQRGFVSNCHCNTVCFGAEFYDAEDDFPLIYVSTGYSADGYTGALVYRITRNNKSFSFTLVQTIRFPVDKSSWTEFIPGDQFAYLCYRSERVIFKVPMPKLKDGDQIISRNDAVETYQFTPQPDWMATSRNQDRMYYQGKILFVSGVPPGEASVFIVLNLESRERERIIDFKKIGLTSEPESIFIWQGDICVAFVDKIVKLYL